MIEQRIRVRGDLFIPQYRRIILWGLVKLWWRDYIYCEYNDIKDAANFLVRENGKKGT